MKMETSYLGLELSSPLVVGANPLTERIDEIKAMEDAGAGAVVLFSLFEEQLTLSKAELNRGRMLYPEEDYWRPKTRTECVDMERPCPFVSCKYHLYIDVHPVRGSIKLNFPDVDVWEMTETCSLDIADRGGITLEEVGEIMNLTRERVRQVETTGLGKLEAVKDIERLKDYVF